MSAVRSGVAVLAMVFAAACVGLVFLALTRTLALRRRRHFLRARGQVTAAAWEDRGNGAGVLRVSYAVDGKEWQRLDFGDAPRSDGERAALLERFAVGTTQVVLVDPKGLEAPMLATGLVPAPRVALVVGLIFLGPAGILAALAWYLGQPGNLLQRVLGGS